MPELTHLAVDDLHVTTSRASKKWGLKELEVRAAPWVTGTMLARLPRGEGRVLLNGTSNMFLVDYKIPLTLKLTLTDSEVGSALAMFQYHDHYY